jgi:hypothetical protein
MMNGVVMERGQEKAPPGDGGSQCTDTRQRQRAKAFEDGERTQDGAKVSPGSRAAIPRLSASSAGAAA